MFEIMFVTLYIFGLAATYVLLRVGGIKILEFSPESFVISVFVLLSFLGLVPIYFHLDPYRASQTPDQSITMAMLVYSTIAICGLAVGFLVRRTLPLTGDVSVPIAPFSGMELAYVSIVCVMCVAIFTYYLTKIGDVAILHLISCDIDGYRRIRSDMTNNFPNYYRYSIFFADLLSAITFCLAAQVFANGGRRTLILFIFSLAVLAFSSISTGEKAPIIYVVIGVFLSYVITKFNGRYLIKPLLGLAVVASVIAGAMYYFLLCRRSLSAASESVTSVGELASGAMENSDAVVVNYRGIFTTAASTFSRATTGTLEAAYHYLEFFPQHHPFLFGASLPNPHNLLPFTHYEITTNVMNWVHPELLDTDIVGSMPTAFWGEAYANFGLAGVVLISTAVGAWISIVSWSARQMPRSAFSVGFLMWIALHFANVAQTGFSKYVIDIRLVLVAFFLLAVPFIGKRLMKHSRRLLRS